LTTAVSLGNSHACEPPNRESTALGSGPPTVRGMPGGGLMLGVHVAALVAAIGLSFIASP
jgi:hypothetical protein